MTSLEIDYNRELDPLVETLASVRRPGSFFATGSVETTLPHLEIRGMGTVAFPVLANQVKEIITHAERAPYGRGEATLVDTSVRRVWQVAPEKVRLGGKTWKKTLATIVSRAAEGLGCAGAPVTAELYKLLVYDKSSFFVSHRDTEKAPGMLTKRQATLPPNMRIHREASTQPIL